MNTQTTSTAPASSLAWRFEQYVFGWNRFDAREPLTRCTTDEQRSGWLAALNSEAVAQLPATSAEKLGF